VDEGELTMPGKAALLVALAFTVLISSQPRPGAQASAQNGAAPGSRATPPGALRQILPGHFVYTHGDDAPGVSATFNSGVIVTSEGIVVVDALSSEAIAARVREAIRRVTPQTVRFLISSTFHDRFTGGNAVYRDAFRIGHENYRADLVRLLEKETPEEQRAKLPNQTYRDRLTLYLGGKEIQVLYLGRAHTRGDSVVFVPADRIVYMSEVLNFQEFPYTADAYPSDWIRTLQAAEALDADIFVPGHGFLPENPRDTRGELARHRQLFAEVRAAVEKELARGATEAQAVANIELPQYRRFKGYSQAMPMAIRRTYQELTGKLR
jgi:glyoxylase-like metal-dependent hydrolase (beta-lactamase superfamily II)